MDDALVTAARAVQQRAYAPYSRYRVGVAIEGEDGTVHLGCNVENASYGLTICAERAAIAAAVSRGVQRFRRVVVVTDSDPPGPPCGACRQVLAEFGDMTVESVGPKGRRQWPLSALLPEAFGPGFLA